MPFVSAPRSSRRGYLHDDSHAVASESYLAATRHPWPCLLYLLPLLLIYECGVLWIGGGQAELLRNGADAWLRFGLERFGLHQLYWAPALVVALLVIGSVVRWQERPDAVATVWLGMAIESVIFAVVLWCISRGLGPLIQALGPAMSYPPQPGTGIGQVVTFVGAGIYEEVIFRLLLYSGLVMLLRGVSFPPIPSVIVGAVVSAVLFSTAHHVGPYGEAFDDFVFVFRTLAGVYFALLYEMRGFGIVVGAHGLYDVLVGVAVG
ncbi:MAG: CPBP family intramembrane metalloprotease [Gemmataceae bacterium]|nr:CPBP family intramembrane metalloprotease [Gemmataceae bacterium]